MKFTAAFLKSFTVDSFDIPIISEWQCKNLYFQNFFIIFYISSLRYFKIYSHFGIYFRISILIFPFGNLFQNIVSVANHNTFVYELFPILFKSHCCYINILIFIEQYLYLIYKHIPMIIIFQNMFKT